MEKRLKKSEPSSGTISVDTPRDRTSSFEPELILAETLHSKILGMYGLGMGLRDLDELEVKWEKKYEKVLES